MKKQLESIDELRFIFTSPTFVTEKTPKAQREFYIPRISRERSLYGTEFEVKLRNELTQKAVAKECADWIRRKAIFKSNVTQEQMMGFMTVDESTYMPINGFTTAIFLRGEKQTVSNGIEQDGSMAWMQHRPQMRIRPLFADIGILRMAIANTNTRGPSLEKMRTSLPIMVPELLP